MDYALYRQVFRRILVTNYVDHHSVPCPNQKSFDWINDEEYQLNIPSNHSNYSFSPYGVLVVGEEACDLAEMLIKKKQDWSRKLKKLEKNVDDDDLKTLRSVKKRKTGNITLGLRQYLEHMTKDPVPGFEPSRNWLYSGGTVKTINCGEESSMIYCSGPGLSEISVMPFSQDENSYSERIKLKIDQPVLQIGVEPSNSLLCVRQKNNITILRKHGPAFKVATKKKVRKTRFFTSCVIQNNMLALTKNIGQLAVFDVNTNQLSFGHKMRQNRLHACPNLNAWSQVEWIDRNLMVVKNKSLTLLDPRDEKICWDLKDSLNDCEDICNYIKTDRNSGYVATSHNLFELDVRQQKFLQKWAHMMKYEPRFGQALTCDNEEIVILQSSNAAEAVMLGVGPPRLLSGPAEGLLDAQLHGICLDPDVSKRVRYNVSGTQIFNCGDSVKQVTQNAGGDIYLRGIHKNAIEDDENDQLRRESWRELETVAPIGTDAYYSEITSMTRALDAIQLPRESESEPAEMYWPKGNRFAPERLHEFKDNMVEPLLEIWNVPTAAEPDAMEEEEEPGISKVEAWLQHHTGFEE